MTGDAKTDDLPSDDKDYLMEFLRVSGREDRALRGQLPLPNQDLGFRRILGYLKSSKERNETEYARYDLFNQILLILGIKPVEYDFFNDLFGDIDFSNLDDIKSCVRKFRTVAMLVYGNLRFSYKVLKFGRDEETKKSLADLFAEYYPTEETIKDRIRKYNEKSKLVGIEKISENQLFALGYLSTEQSKSVNDARVVLREILKEFNEEIGSSDYGELEKFGNKFLGKNGHLSRFQNFSSLVGKAGIPRADGLLGPLYNVPGKSLNELIVELIGECKVVDEEVVKETQKSGEINTAIYLGLHDLDVYNATSMRSPLHFTTNRTFTQSLFTDDTFDKWNIHYFDPTQSYLKDRIQKGLLESLMIKRAKVTIYNAQEEDTFGKDSEAAVALAQGKDVIVYVARLFFDETSLTDMYRLLDSAPRLEYDQLLEGIRERKLLQEDEIAELASPGMTKLDCVKRVTRERAKTFLEDIETNSIKAELMHHGYEVSKDGEELVNLVADKMSDLEKRALMFKDIHPLSFQISVRDGVARGLIVARSIKQTAKVLQGLLLGNLEYEIVEQTNNILLLEKITESPVRVVTNNQELTTAFWSEFSRERSRFQKNKR